MEVFGALIPLESRGGSMPQMQHLVPQLTILFYAVGYLSVGVFVCAEFYRYVAAAVETRSIFHRRVRMTAPLAALFVVPVMVLRQFDVPKSVAFGLETVAVLAMLALMALGLGRIADLFSLLVTSTPQDDDERG
jgi:hypothetical protein